MDRHKVDEVVVTTEPAISGPTPPDAMWAPDAQPAAQALPSPAVSPVALTIAAAPTVAPVAAPAAPAAPAATVWFAPVASPAAPAAPPFAAVAPMTAAAAQPTVQTFRRRTTRTSFENAELTRRIVVLVFGLIELFIGMRVVLLLLDARTTNGLVSGILSLSGPFVAPFEGILKTNSVSASGSVLDVAALLALAGWAVVEMVVFWVMATFRREPA